jgi:hypothetical protein
LPCAAQKPDSNHPTSLIIGQHQVSVGESGAELPNPQSWQGTKSGINRAQVSRLPQWFQKFMPRTAESFRAVLMRPFKFGHFERPISKWVISEFIISDRLHAGGFAMNVRLLAPLYLITFAEAAHAEVTGYNIDLSSSAGSSSKPGSTFGGAAGQFGYWNAMTSGADEEPLLDINGSDFAATFSSSGGYGSLSYNNSSTTGNFQNLLDDFQDTDAASGEITLTINGLEPGEYLVFTYALGPDGTSFRSSVNVVQSASGSQTVGGTFASNFQFGVTHAMHTANVGVDQELTVTVSSANHYGSVNGLQIVPLSGLAAAFGEANGDQFGRSVACIGDINNDQWDDFVVGAPYHDGNGSNAGHIYIYSGLTAEILHEIDGDAAGDQFGYAVAGGGDVNADGFPDFIVSAPFSNQSANDAGKVYVFSSADFSTIYTKVGSTSGDRIGHAIAGGIDINDDGHDDFLVGAPESKSKDGQLFVYSGATGSKLKTIKGKKDDKLGWAIAPLARTNSDDHADFAVSSPLNDEEGSNAGKVTVYSGKDFSVRYTINGNKAGDQFGYSLAAAGRANTDSRDDFVVGSPYYDTPGKTSRGRVELFSGTNGNLLWAKTGSAAGDRLGWVVSGVGDVNGDGRADIAAAATYSDFTGTDSGRVQVRSGLDGSSIANIDGAAVGDRFAWALTGLRDPNGDGFNDILAGAPYHDLNGSASGKIYVVSFIEAAQGPAPENDGGIMTPIKKELAPTVTGNVGGPGAITPMTDEYCLGDLNLSGAVNNDDLLTLLGIWGACDQCPEDLSGDGVVDTFDLSLLIDAWGSCP